MSSYAYRLDIRNPSTGAPVSGLTSVELRNGYAAYVFAEVGNGVYSIASIPAGRYDLYISNVSTGQSYGVGEGELAGLGYSDGTRLKSTASALQWDDTQYSAINHTHSHSSLTGINDGSYKHISSTEKGYLERANNPTGVLILNGEGKVDENNLPNHNNLSGIQGGTVGEYYHDNLAQHNQKVNAGAANGYALLNASAVLPDAVMSATLADNAASSTLPTVASGTVTSKVQQIRDYLKYLLSQIGLKVTANTAITAGTATKITYDAKGLVTAGATATATDIANTPAGNIAATTVQAALNELDSEKLAITTASSTYAPLSSVPAVDSVPTDGSSNAVSSNGVFDALATKANEPTLYTNRLPGDSNARVRICEWKIEKAGYYGGSLTVRIWQYDIWYSYGYCDVLFRWSITGSEASLSYSFEYAGGSTSMIPDIGLRQTNDATYRYFMISCNSTNPRIQSQLLSNVVSAGSNPITVGHRNVADTGGPPPVALAPTPPASDNSQAIANTAWVTSRAVPTIITANATLPAGAPIGKSVFVEDVGGSSITVTAPSGEVIAYNAASGYSSVNISNYSGVWFVKSRSNRWTVDRAL